ncbi:hypothetical protein [Spiroplasma endosymbiont of Polydrusus pterygomalis]|uniref:hypothetical protein n=1 Tax=Spiroplasma endosymbiont of Polydrusus pterygomalis TaxID=3139327 RepID=UPI003CCB1145
MLVNELIIELEEEYEKLFLLKSQIPNSAKTVIRNGEEIEKQRIKIKEIIKKYQSKL